MQVAALPQDLVKGLAIINLNQWVGYRYPDKIPLNARTGEAASSTDPATWTDYETALQAAEKYKWQGIGFVLTEEAEIVGIDLDDCIDAGNIAPWAMEIIRAVDSYTEISPSGKGVHILAYGLIDKALKTEQVEIYARGRYFTVTGNHLEGTPGTINHRARAIKALWSQYQPPPAPPAPPASSPSYQVNSEHPYVKNAFENELNELAATTAKRNDRLNKAAFALGQFIGAGQLDRGEVESALYHTAITIGLTENETRKTIRSGIDSGIATPRTTFPDFTTTESPPPPSKKDDFLLYETFDDEGHAQSVARLYQGRFLYCDEVGWLAYTGKFWSHKNAEARLDRAIIATLKKRRIRGIEADNEKLVKATKATAANVRNTKFLFSSLVAASITDFDTNPDLLNCNNGVVDLRTGRIISHDPQQRFTYCLKTNYNPDADDSVWVNWLYSAITPIEFNGNHQTYTNLLAWLQMAIGYSMTGRTNEQCMFYIHGLTRAGKGLLLQILKDVLGKPMAYGVDFDTFTAKRGGDSQNFDLAPLKAARLIIASESDRANMLNSKVVKAITGNDAVYCAFKHRTHFEYTPQFKIWLSSNFPVMADANDDALWGRLRVITFPNSYLGKEDFTLASKLMKNAEGILKWAVAGAIEWYKQIDQNKGLGHPDIITQTTQAHRDENDIVKQFIDECCKVGPDYDTIGRQFTSAYRDWCKDNGFEPLGGRRMGAAMRAKGFVYKDARTGDKVTKHWIGIGLLANL